MANHERAHHQRAHDDRTSSESTAPASPRASSSKLSLLSALGVLGWPILLGLAATSVFFILIYRGPLNLPVMHRYFASHPVTFAETALFFIGLASLGLKVLEVTGQYWFIGRVHLSPPPDGGQSPETASELLAELDQLDASARSSPLVARLRQALEFVRRTGSSDHLPDELKYLADMDAAKQQDGYSLVRIVIWATPMLGFLGTVMGITQALGDLSANAELLATSIDTAIQGLLAGLYVAFDTTALALTLSMMLMFIQFIIDRAETQFLSEVDSRTTSEMVGRFQGASYSSDPHVATIEKMAHAVVRSSEQLVQRQSQLWNEALTSSQKQWRELVESTAPQVSAAVETALQSTLAKNLQDHSQRVARFEQELLAQSEAGWQKTHAELGRRADEMRAQHAELSRHSEILLEVVRATGDVVRLEQALNSNLAALAGAKNFEDTVMSLSAAIHLLTTRLGRTGDAPAVELPRRSDAGRSDAARNDASPIAGAIRPAASNDNVTFASWVSPELPPAAPKSPSRQGKAA